MLCLLYACLIYIASDSLSSFAFEAFTSKKTVVEAGLLRKQHAISTAAAVLIVRNTNPRNTAQSVPGKLHGGAQTTPSEQNFKFTLAKEQPCQWQTQKQSQ